MDTLKEVFDLAMLTCKDKISEVAYGLWLSDLKPISFDGNNFVLSIKTEFKKNILEEKYMTLLTESFESVIGFSVNIQFVCETNHLTNATPINKPTTYAQKTPITQYSSQQSILSTQTTQIPTYTNPAPDNYSATNLAVSDQPFGGEYEYNFDTFIIGSSNKFAHAASWAVATNPAKSYNPLFIYGDSGLGKTHLVCAICEEIRKNNPTFNIIYVKGEEFTNELINAISRKNTQEFHDKYRAADLLAVDDIQFIGGKESTQEEFFHTFNTLYHAGKQIILTSDRPPKEIKTLEDRLRTRFEWGLLADIQAPDFETRMAIIKRKAELLHFIIPDDVCDYISNRLKTNIRQLEGVVKKLNAYNQLAGSAPTILLAQTAIKDILNDHQPLPMTVDRIVTEVARTYCVTPEDIRGSKRAGNISIARQISMYIIREITPMSTTAIGEEFNNRDHSTVVYACQQVNKMIKQNTRVKEIIDDIIKNIKAS